MEELQSSPSLPVWQRMNWRVVVPLILFTLFVTRILWMINRSQAKWAKKTGPNGPLPLARGQIRFEPDPIEEDIPYMRNFRPLHFPSIDSSKEGEPARTNPSRELSGRRRERGLEKGKERLGVWEPLDESQSDSQTGASVNENDKEIINDEVRRSESARTKVRVDFIDPLVEELEAKFEKYEGPIVSVSETERRAAKFYETMRSRRTVRQISSRSVPREVIEHLVRVAHSAPSGANTQPWTFVVIESLEMKEKLRLIIEAEEKMNYERRMGDVWVTDLKKLGTHWEKPYLTEAPYVIVLLRQIHGITQDGRKIRHYYPEMSCAIAAGFLVAAIHNAGLVTVTSTPLNAGGNIRELLGRPSHERVELVLPVGYPAVGAEVPKITKKPLSEVLKFV